MQPLRCSLVAVFSKAEAKVDDEWVIYILHGLLGLAYNFLSFPDWNQIFVGLIVVTKKQVFPRGFFAKSCMERERKLPT